MITNNKTALHAQLARTIRRGRILTAPAQLAGYDADGLGYKTFRPDAVVIPADADELVAFLRDAKSLDMPITMRGAGTSLSGGPVAAQGGVVVHTSSLKKIRTINREGLWCEVESSVVLNQLDAALAPHALFYPPDPSSGPVCTLGGNVAMNAGGAHCFRYGVTSNYVLGLEVVLLDGSVHRFGGPAGGRGDYAEDWKRLMVGSEGTLGAFTRFWLRLLPRPEKAWTYRATFADLHSAERAIHALSSHPSFPVAIELMDPRCVAMVENSPMAVGLPINEFLIVTEIDGPAVLVDARAQQVAELLKSSGATSVEFSDDELQRKKLWKARKVAGGLMGQLSPDFFVQDAVIPKRALAEVLQLVYDEADAAGLATVNVFHAGDGNLHPNFLFNSKIPGEYEKVEAICKRLMEHVVEVGGTLSGEHGIGNDKTAYMPLMFDETMLKLQLSIPKLFNPQHQLNPLKVFNTRQFANRLLPKSHHSHSPKSLSSSQSKSERGLFEHFIDPIDGVMCCSAETMGQDFLHLHVSHGLRFPLLLSGTHSLREQVASSNFGPSSSRFGPYCDNILGMNWRLPSGRIVRIGERVVKSTTGYDLMRFLLQSQGRFGEPTDFVIRLRPDCRAAGTFDFTGPDEQLIKVAKELVSTCWLHWFEAIDLHYSSKGCLLRLKLNCGDGEWQVYKAHLAKLAESNGLELNSNLESFQNFDGCPDLMLKTTPDRAISLAQDIVGNKEPSKEHSREEWNCIVMLACGVVHVYPTKPTSEAKSADKPASLTAIVDRHKEKLFAVGGEWRSRHLPPPQPTGLEAQWLAQLDQEFAVI